MSGYFLAVLNSVCAEALRGSMEEWLEELGYGAEGCVFKS